MKKIFLSVIMVLVLAVVVACGKTQVSIKFNTNGGSPVSELKFDQGTIIDLEDPIRNGYSFLGWYNEETLETKFENGTKVLRNLTLFAKWQINQYTVRFHIAEDNIIEIKDDFNNQYTKPQDPAKEGYVFIGWYSDKALTKEVTSFRIPASDMDIYPKFSQNQHTVRFMAEGKLVSTLTVKYGEKIQGYPGVPPKTGYDAVWSIDVQNVVVTSNLEVEAIYTAKEFKVTFKDEQGNIYSEQNIKYGEKVETPQTPTKEGYKFLEYSEDLTTLVITSNLDIIIYFTQNSYTVTFLGQNNSNLKTQQVLHGQAALAPDAPVIPGYTFTGWDKTFNQVVSSMEIKAVYTTNQYEIKFTQDDDLATDILANYNSTVTLPVISKQGYIFDGWYNETNNQKVTQTITVPLNGMTLYAKFILVNYSITYHNLNGLASNNVSTFTVESNDILLSNPQTKVGHEFIGWSTTADGLNLVTKINKGTVSNINLYAIYEAINYTVTFNFGETTSQITLPYGSVINEANITAIPTKTHYDVTAPRYDVNPLGHVVSNDITFNAVYTPNTYTITLVLNNSEDNILVSGIYNTTIESFETPTLEGKNFAGWYKDITLQTEFTETAYQSDLTIYAKYTDYKAISFNTFGGSILNPISLEANATVTLPTNVTKYGYTFAGWYLDTNFENVAEITVMPETDITLYAKWQVVQFTVTYNVDGVLTTEKFDYNTEITEINVQIPTKPNYDDKEPGWLVDPIGHVVIADITFTVVYVPNLLDVTLDLGDETVLNEVKVSYNQKLNQADIKVKIKNGFNFVAWYSDESLLNRFDFNSVVTENITLYAQWERLYYEVDVNSIFEQEDLIDEEIITVNDNLNFSIINVYYEQSVDVVRFYEGYDFDRIVYNNETFRDIDHLILVMGNMIDENAINVYYRRIILEITFIQDPQLFEENDLSHTQTFKVYFGTDFTNVPTLVEKTGYDVLWDRAGFENIRQDIIVQAQYFEKGIPTLRFIDGATIRYIAVKQNENDLVAINTDSILWDLTKTGYTFAGWYLNPQFTGESIQRGEILYSANYQVLYAKWNELTRYEKPTNIEVVVNDTTLSISWLMNPALVNGLTPRAFSIFVNYNEVLVDGLDVVLVGNKYELIIDLENINADYEYLSILNSAGTHTVSIMALGNDLETYDSLMSDLINHSKDSQFDGDPSEVAVYDNFIIESFIKNGIETKRYVFYPGLRYVFNETYRFEIVSGNEYASVNQNELMTHELTGDFRFRMIKNDETPVIYDAVIVQSITQFSYGTSYQNYLNRSNVDSTYINKGLATPYYVGDDNNFYFDIRMINSRGSRVTINQVDLTYKFFILENNTMVELDDVRVLDYVQMGENNQFKMKALALNHTFEVKVSPKYQTLSRTVEPLTFEFKVIDGTNVFTNTGLQTSFSNINIETIILHANITAELREDQKNKDGSPINNNKTDGSIIGNVYQRYSNNKNTDNLVIEGNYMTVNGSSLPYINKNSGLDPLAYSPLLDIMNVQIGIFSYNVFQEGLIRDAMIEGQRDAVVINDNQFTINNLTIIGNTKTPYINYAGSSEEILVQERLMSRNSGGYLGIYQRAGNLNLNNTQLGFTLISLSNSAEGVKSDNTRVTSTINQSRIYDSWANSIYLTGAVRLELMHSEILSSGGASLHAVDRLKGNDVNDIEIVLHDSTTIKNYVSGDEAWFKAYGMSGAALNLKSGIQSGISSTKRSVIYNAVNPITGLTSEMLNLILLTEPSESANTYSDQQKTQQNGGSTVIIKYVDNNGNVKTTLQRAWNFLQSGDPRIVASMNTYAFPVGNLAEIENFGAFANEIGALLVQGGHATPQTAPAMAAELAPLGAFYNLSAEQTIILHGTASQMGNDYTLAYNYMKSQSQIAANHEKPKHLEVITNLPILGLGNSIVLLEIFN